MSSPIGIVKAYIDESIQATAAGIIKCKELRNDPDLFQRVGQVAVFSLELIMATFEGAANLRPLTFVIATVGMFDFCRILKQPRQFFLPIDVETIDEGATLYSLTQAVLVADDNRNFSELPPQPVTMHSNTVVLDERVRDSNQRSRLQASAKMLLEEQFQEMKAKNDAYSSPQEFKTVLQNRLRDSPTLKSSKVDFQNINWDDVKIFLRHVPLVEKGTNLIWAVVDIGCVGLYLRTWKFIDTAQWAARIGQNPYFQWVRNQHLDRCVTGLVCVAFALKFIEAYRKLEDDTLTQGQRIQACWNRITAAAEFLLWGTVFLKLSDRINIDNTYIFCLGIIVKSIGVLSIAMRTKHRYIQHCQPPKWVSIASQ